MERRSNLDPTALRWGPGHRTFPLLRRGNVLVLEKKNNFNKLNYGNEFHNYSNKYANAWSSTS